MGLARKHPGAGELYREGRNPNEGVRFARALGRIGVPGEGGFPGRFLAGSDRARAHPSSAAGSERQNRRAKGCRSPTGSKKNHPQFQVEKTGDRTKRLYIASGDDKSSVIVVTFLLPFPENATP